MPELLILTRLLGTSLGRDVEIVVKDAPRRRAGGKLTVVFA
jgi:hypothetical protein